MPAVARSDPFEDADEIRLASQDQISEWEEEVERWLPEAVGHSVHDWLLTDGTDLDHFMDCEPTGERDERGEELHWATAESWNYDRTTEQLVAVGRIVRRKYRLVKWAIALVGAAAVLCLGTAILDAVLP